LVAGNIQGKNCFVWHAGVAARLAGLMVFWIGERFMSYFDTDFDIRQLIVTPSGGVLYENIFVESCFCSEIINPRFEVCYEGIGGREAMKLYELDFGTKLEGVGCWKDDSVYDVSNDRYILVEAYRCGGCKGGKAVSIYFA